MKYSDKHSNSDTDFFQKVEIPYEKSKEELWDMLSIKLDEVPQEKAKTKTISFVWIKSFAAAVVIIVLASTFFLRFYSVSIHSAKGEHLSHLLPDGSLVQMNAQSSISYNPYWWKLKRELSFEGEAFFDIEEGQRFSIKSNNGTTEILGTSFNIYTRNSNYRVFCKTGLVKVSSEKANVAHVINPGELVIIDNDIKQSKIEISEARKILAWQNNKFSFTSEPLSEVIKELERQYDVQINMNINNPKQLFYTGYFTKDSTVESSLNFICKSFNLNFKIDRKGNYIVLKNK